MWFVVYSHIKNLDFHFHYDPFGHVSGLMRVLLSQRFLVLFFLIDRWLDKTFWKVVLQEHLLSLLWRWTRGKSISMQPISELAPHEMLLYSSLFHPRQVNFTSEGRLREGPRAEPDHQMKNEVLWWPILHSRFCFLFFELHGPKSISPSLSETILIGQVNQYFILENIKRRHRLRDIIYSRNAVISCEPVDI